MKVQIEGQGEVEVYTAEEVDAKVKAASESSVKELQTKLNDVTSKLEEAAKGGGNENQVERLRQERDAAIKAIEDNNKKWEGEITAIKQAIDPVPGLLDQLSHGDKELRDKLEVEFNNYRPNDATPQAVRERMEKAYQLVQGTKPKPNTMDNLGGFSGNRGEGAAPQATKELTDNGKAISKVLGINEEQAKAAKEFLAKQKGNQ